MALSQTTRIDADGPFWASFDVDVRNRLHLHPTYFEISLVLSGRGEFVHSDERFALRRGDLFVADIGREHEITSLRTRDLSICFVTLTFEPGDGPRLAEDQAVRAFLRSHRTLVRKQWHLLAWSDLIRDHHERDLPLRAYVGEELLRLFVMQMLASLTDEHVPALEPRAAVGDVVERAIDVIEARLSGPLRVATVASEAGVSERSLQRAFQTHLRRSVAQEIQIRRTERACRLLSRGDLSIAEVGRRVGFDDPTSFTRTFRRVQDMSPLAFRAGVGGFGRLPQFAGMRTRYVDD